MAEFTVNGDRLQNAVELIRRQNQVLEHADGLLGEVDRRLAIEGEAKDRIRLALNKEMCQVRVDMRKIEEMSVALQKIAEAYWTSERKVQEQKTTKRILYAIGIDFGQILAPPVGPDIINHLIIEPFWKWRTFDLLKELKLTIAFSHGYLPIPEWEVIHFCPLDIGSLETSWKQRSV